MSTDELTPRHGSSLVLVFASSPLSAGCWFELRVAEFDLAASVQEDAEDDAGGVGRDLGSDLVPGPVAGSGDEGEVVLGIMQGISSVWALLPQPSLAGTRSTSPARPATSVARR